MLFNLGNHPSTQSASIREPSSSKTISTTKKYCKWWSRANSPNKNASFAATPQEQKQELEWDAASRDATTAHIPSAPTSTAASSGSKETARMKNSLPLTIASIFLFSQQTWRKQRLDTTDLSQKVHVQLQKDLGTQIDPLQATVWRISSEDVGIKLFRK